MVFNLYNRNKEQDGNKTENLYVMNLNHSGVNTMIVSISRQMNNQEIP